VSYVRLDGHNIQTVIAYSNERKHVCNRYRWTRRFNTRRAHLILDSNIHTYVFVYLFYLWDIPAKQSRRAKQATPLELGSPHEKICAGFIDICFFIPTDLQAQFPTCATRRAGVIGTSTYPSIPKTTVNVMRPKRPNWTSSLAKANRHRLFIERSVYPN
jgi:hypothetical protein